MPISRVLRLAVVGAVAASGLAACRRPIPPGATPVADSAGVGRGSAGGGLSSADSAGRAAAEGAPSLDDEGARAAAELRNALLAPVYFEFDQADLSEQTRAALVQKSVLLGRYPSVIVRVAGHTDSRGSDEYNLALGQRRAAIVKRFLVDRGVSASRLELVSYGEERPAAEGDDEEARSQNPRAEFEITAGADFNQPSSQSPTSP
jgi:peptidoglycan-associated lipoprotein